MSPHARVQNKINIHTRREKRERRKKSYKSVEDNQRKARQQRREVTLAGETGGTVA